MPEINAEANRYFENKVYLPMLITVLERDLLLFQTMPFKLSRPYIALADGALKRIRADLKATDIYMVRHHMRLVGDKTEYILIYSGIEERWTLTSEQIRCKCEELLRKYLVE